MYPAPPACDPPYDAAGPGMDGRAAVEREPASVVNWVDMVLRWSERSRLRDRREWGNEFRMTVRTWGENSVFVPDELCEPNIRGYYAPHHRHENSIQFKVNILVTPLLPPPK